MTPVDRGLILFAHGARDPRWAEPFEQVAAGLRRLDPGLQVRLAFLEFMAPTLPQAATQLVAEGATSLTVLPMFLGVGGHVRKDLPALLQTIREHHPGVAVHLTPAIGEQPAVLEAMAQAAAQLARETTR